MIKIMNLKFGYRNKEKLFKGLNLELKPGNIYGLLGKNGAGKTTLLKIISGLLFPQSGICEVFSFPSKKRLPQVLEEIYFIPEEFYIPDLTIKEYLSLYSEFYPRFNCQQFTKFVNDFEIHINEKLSSFSYGQKKKFLLAFGISTNCKLLILDEPTNGLDIPTKSLFRKILAISLTDERTYIISTHQVRDMENLIDPILILDDGQIIFNHYIHEVSKYLTVRIQQNEPDYDKIIYAEGILGGYSVVDKNESGEESNINLELLFNAVINNKEKVAKVFGDEV
jgi:ABC-2 type transport system ATP-binding protein